jgi:hypothetical protein
VIVSAVATIFTLVNVALLIGVNDSYPCPMTCHLVVALMDANLAHLGLTPLIMLVPIGSAFIFTVVCWRWELSELRRQGATRVALVTQLFPQITLVVMISAVLLSVIMEETLALDKGGSLRNGLLAIATWPALITLVALVWRGAAPNDSVSAPPTSPTSLTPERAS